MPDRIELTRGKDGRWMWTFNAVSGLKAQGNLRVKASTKDEEAELVKDKLKKLFDAMSGSLVASPAPAMQPVIKDDDSV